MDVIDAHVHLYSYRDGEFPWITADMPGLRRDHLPAQLEPLLDAAAVSGCVAVEARQRSAETDQLLELAHRWPRLLAVVGWVDLVSESIAADLDRWQDRPLLKGFRHVIIDEPDPLGFLARPDVRSGIAELGRRGYSYDLLLLPEMLIAAGDLVSALPNVQFVLDHAGLPDIRGGKHTQWAADLLRLAANPNVTVKLSGLDFRARWHEWQPAQLYPYIDSVIATFGPDRVMIGSNWPVCTLSSDYSTSVGTLLDRVSALSESEQGQILSGTARRVYRIP